MAHNRFRITHSINVPGGGSRYLQIGQPEPQLMYNDICIIKEGTYEFIPLNSIMLREALLNSASLLQTCLGIDVKVHEEPQPKRKKKAEVTTNDDGDN